MTNEETKMDAINNMKNGRLSKMTKRQKKLEIIRLDPDYSKYEGEKLLVCVSGGQTSMFMAKWINENLSNIFSEIKYVFNNTGLEVKQTLDFIKKCSEYFGIEVVLTEAVTDPRRGFGVKSKIVTYETASMNGEPFEAMISKHGIPNISVPHCSRELKRYVNKAYARSIGWKTCYTAIGIRSDEIDRVSETYKKDKVIYPLISMVPTTKNQINGFWLNMPFRLEIKSYEGNCKTCWKKSLAKLLTIAHENPSWFDFFEEMESKYEEYIPESKIHNEKIELPIRFFRENLSVSDIREMAKTITPEQLAKDDSIFYQGELFPLHVSNGCEESCNTF